MTQPSSFSTDSAEPDSDSEAAEGTQGLELEQTLVAVEQRLSALGLALFSLDLPAIERHGFELHRELLQAVQCFSQAACQRVLPFKLKQRMVEATSKVAAQRETLARATEALDRAIDVLIQFEAPSVSLQTQAAGLACAPEDEESA
jgi:hypothetical protein